jgi:hypothetical protein
MQIGAEQRKTHLQQGQKPSLAEDPLFQVERGATQADDPGPDLEKVVEPGRGAILDEAAPDREHDPEAGAQGAVIEPEAPQHLGAGPLGEREIRGVVDDPAASVSS